MRSLNFVPDTCGVHYKFATEKWIEKIHDLGMKVLVWTVNKEEDIKYHLSMNVDGIITDYPELAMGI